MGTFLKRAKELEESIRNDRKFLHQHAETGDRLSVTTSYVMMRLKEIGLEPEEICRSGISAVIYGKYPGKTILLHAGMDAHDVKNAGVSMRAVHTGGHDMNVAMLLAAAEILHENAGTMYGAVKLMFQPAVETGKGASAMIRAGILEHPKVHAALTVHASSVLETESFAYGTGCISPSSDLFRILVGEPGTGEDIRGEAVLAAMQIYRNLCMMKQDMNGARLTMGQFHAGEEPGQIPQTALMEGILTVEENQQREEFLKTVREVVRRTECETGQRAEFQLLLSSPAVCVDPQLAEEMAEFVTDLSEDGSDWIKEKQYRIAVPEDFAYIAQLVPSAYLAAGCRTAGKECLPQQECFDERMLPLGAAVYAVCAFRWLNRHRKPS